MADRYEGSSPRKGKDGKTYWTRVATMWPAKDGADKFMVVLEALPLPDAEGRVSIVFSPPLPKDRDDRPRDDDRPARPARQAETDDDIPF